VDAREKTATKRSHTSRSRATSQCCKLRLPSLAVVAEFELDLLKERTAAGLARARTEGKRLGCPSALSAQDAAEVAAKFEAGVPIAALARAYGVGRATIQRLRPQQ
jgi:putative DNA-invertase from lambdoid prophage Rac